MGAGPWISLSTEHGAVTEAEFAAVVRHLDDLVQEFEGLPFPQVREHVFDLLQTVDALHRAGLGRLLDVVQEHDDGALMTRAGEDPIVRMLLTLYDFLPGDPPPKPAPSPANFIPLSQIGRRPAAAPQPPVFTEVARLEEVPPGAMKIVDVDGVHALLANVGGEVYAVGAVCPGSMAPLGLGAFTPPVVVCPWHNEAFDVRTGKRVDGLPTPTLEVLPIDVRDGVIALALHAADPAGAGRQAP